SPIIPVVSISRQLWKSLTGSWLNVLLFVAPVSWFVASRGESLWVFVLAAITLIPAAGLIGEATEELANRSGPTLGGFLNATFGNAAELIIAIVALGAHHVEIVKASITGSIIGNLLLVFGASCFAGGLKHGTQRFNRTAAGSATVMLSLAVAALVMPATVDLFAFGSLNARPEVLYRLSTWTSYVLLVVYAAGLVFAFRTNRDPLRAAGHRAPRLSRAAALTLLATATLLTTVEAEILVRGLEPALKQFGMSELFAGVIVVALVGNAAEHYSAISAAMKNDMTLALEISVGSSAQIALMVAPLLVLIAPALGQPISLVLNPFEIAAIGLSVGTVALVGMDGESNWLEGLQLLGLYVILAAAFYVIPG
ncbi:MAG TPA: calcium/proton exchanger, partial [Vicinamibacterales bacterium]